jgi:hypothetical protein
MNTLSKSLVAGVAGLATIALAMPAHANHKLVGAFIGGAVLGTVLANAAPVYGAPVYGGYGPSCGWRWQKQFTGYYNAYGQPIYKKVQVQVCW